jgi:hypothetical protein
MPLEERGSPRLDSPALRCDYHGRGPGLADLVNWLALPSGAVRPRASVVAQACDDASGARASAGGGACCGCGACSVNVLSVVSASARIESSVRDRTAASRPPDRLNNPVSAIPKSYWYSFLFTPNPLGLARVPLESRLSNYLKP